MSIYLLLSYLFLIVSLFFFVWLFHQLYECRKCYDLIKGKKKEEDTYLAGRTEE
jgi:hypothetical protein